MKNLIHISIIILISSLTTAQGNLENILSAPYSSDLAKSQNGNYLAWVTNSRGVREIFAHDVINNQTNKFFSSGEDSGMVIGNLTISNDGQQVFFNYGSAPNRHGETANPSSFIHYPKRLILRVTKEAELDTIGPHGGFLLHPDQSSLLIPKGNDLLKLDIQTKKSEKIAGMRGTFSDIQVGQDGTLLFTSLRGGHSFIGMIKKGSNSIEWIAPGVDKDRYPRFSPYGKKVAFLRMDGDMKGYLNDITSGYPFKVMVYNLENNQLDTVWHAPNEAGGFAQYYNNEPLRWSSSNHLIFYSEHEGYMKIYVMNPDGSELKSVINGQCEVEFSDINVEGDMLVFNSNCENEIDKNYIDSRNIYIYDLHKEELQRHTSGINIESHPKALNGSSLVYTSHAFDVPSEIFKSINGVEEEISMNDYDFGDFRFVRPKQIVFESLDGISVHGQLFDHGLGGEQPAVIFMHGGPVRQMLLGYHYSSYYANAYAFNQYLASKGYVVFSVNFRAGIGYGKKFRRAKNQGPRGASEYQDILAAAKYLQDLDQVHPNRIGLWGGSYGGYLTAMGLARNSDVFKAGVDLHGVHDWSWRAADFSKGGFWGINDELMELAHASSPVASMNSWTSPVLLVHGDDDRNVMFGQTIDLVRRLRERNVHHEILSLPDEVHGFYRWKSWLKTFQTAASFFDRKL